MAGAARSSVPPSGPRDGRSSGQDRGVASVRAVKQLAKLCAAATTKVRRGCMAGGVNLRAAHTHPPACFPHGWQSCNRLILGRTPLSA
jgi:hypothetical protein